MHLLDKQLKIKQNSLLYVIEFICYFWNEKHSSISDISASHLMTVKQVHNCL